MIWHSANIHAQGCDLATYHLRFGSADEAKKTVASWRSWKDKRLQVANFRGRHGFVYRRYGVLGPGWIVAGAKIFDPTLGGSAETFASEAEAEGEHERRETSLF